MMKRFQGVFPALVTPFTSEGKVDGNAMEKLVKWNLDKGVSGFYVGGSTAESFLLSADERKYALEVVMNTVGNKADVIANIGMFSTEQGIDLAKHADRLGVSAISSVPPFYFKYNQNEYFKYYADILQEVSVPMLIYNVPALSGVNFTEADFDNFFAHDKIIGAKYTSYDLFMMQRMISQHQDKSIIIGHDEIYLSALAAGARALIGSTVGFMAEKYIQIEKLYQEGKMHEALQIQSDVNEIISVLSRIGVFKGVKAALSILGIPCEECRKPFQPLSSEEMQLLSTVLGKTIFK